MKYFLSLSLFFFTIFSLAQDSTRVTVKGKIIVNTPDVEGVTVFNISSNKGTITDEKGEFTLQVMLNDKVEVSALQFKDFSLTVTESIIKNKQMTVFLVEQVNKLDEVVILPYDLTGVLKEDIESVEVFNPDMDAIYFGVDDISVYEFSDDQYSKVENYAAMNQNDRIRYQANGVAIVEGLVNLIFKPKKKSKNTNTETEKIPTQTLADKYQHDYYTKNFNIPEEQVEAFIAFVQNNDFDVSLLEKGNEMQLIEDLNKRSKKFLSENPVEKE